MVRTRPVLERLAEAWGSPRRSRSPAPSARRRFMGSYARRLDLLPAELCRGHPGGADGGDGDEACGNQHQDHRHPELIEDGRERSADRPRPGRSARARRCSASSADRSLRRRLGAGGREKVISRLQRGALRRGTLRTACGPSSLSSRPPHHPTSQSRGSEGAS